VSKQVEYEGEIGVVIGRSVRNANEAQAREAIAAIIAVNDVTARDLQKTDGQWTRAKGFDTFCAIGEPAAPPADLSSIEVVTRVNGTERQRAKAAEMTFAIPALIVYISGVMTLEPGDLIATGTPAGVGPLAAGDTVEIELTGLSLVRNPVALAP
jgi:2-keto-4-pentenoate hydratase/2-oxohepta-3-ene-1,7-dioic acid hydratase in catechol pathway